MWWFLKQYSKTIREWKSWWRVHLVLDGTCGWIQWLKTLCLLSPSIRLSIFLLPRRCARASDLSLCKFFPLLCLNLRATPKKLTAYLQFIFFSNLVHVVLIVFFIWKNYYKLQIIFNFILWIFHLFDLVCPNTIDLTCGVAPNINISLLKYFFLFFFKTTFSFRPQYMIHDNWTYMIYFNFGFMVLSRSHIHIASGLIIVNPGQYNMSSS